MSWSWPRRTGPETAPAPAPLLRVRTEWLADRTLVLALIGEVTVHRRGALLRSLDEAIRQHPDLLVADLTRIGFCDSTVLNALLHARLGARAAGVPLVLAGAPSQARRLLRLTGLDRVFTLEPTVEAAVSARQRDPLRRDPRQRDPG